MDWLFPWLLFLHVLGAIVAFGPTFTFALIGAMGGAERQHGNFALRASEMIASRLVYPIGITLPITGAAMMAVRGIDPSDRPNWWLGLAIVLYLISYGYSFFVQRREIARMIELTGDAPSPGTGGPPPELPGLARRIQLGGMAMGLSLVAIVFLMVVKPQF